MTDLPFLFDGDYVVWIQELMGLGWPGPWRVLTLLGTNWGILLVVGLALWLWGRQVAYALLAVVAVDGILKTATNRLLHVPRPDAPGLVKYEHVDLGSFPSGHVSTAAGLWAFLAYRRRVSWILAGAVILLVGLSRLYLGVHFVADVVGGILLAVIVVVLVQWLWPPLRDWLARRSFGFWIATSIVALAGVVAGTFFYFGGNPYRWRAGGLVAGLAIALPLEYRYVRYRPGDVSTGRKVAMVLVGTAGIAVMAAIDQLTGEWSNSLGLATTALAGLWAMLVAPTIFAKLGWAARDEPRREQRVDRTARGLGIATAVLAGVLLYGMAIEPRMMLDTEEWPGAVPGLPPAWEGATVAVASDFQLGLWLDNTGTMGRAIEKIVARDPEIALLAGDFIYHAGPAPGATIRGIMDVLRPLVEAEIPTYAVLGNHDWGLPKPLGESEPNREAARMLRDSLEAAGIVVLDNRAVEARPPGGGDPLYIVGIASNYMELDDPVAAVADVPDGAARFVMMHNPSSFQEIPAGSAPLAVAGHTHGGQVRLPFTPQWSWLTFTRDDAIHADGWIEEAIGEEGNRLYVTRGLGMSLIPLRINCPPELTYFTLRRGDSGEGPESGTGPF